MTRPPNRRQTTHILNVTHTPSDPLILTLASPSRGSLASLGDPWGWIAGARGSGVVRMSPGHGGVAERVYRGGLVVDGLSSGEAHP